MPQSNETLETKAFGAFAIKDAEKGEVTAIVATLGVVDRDGDVLLPEAFPSVSHVKLSAYGHDIVLDGAPPVGKGTITVEGNKAVFQGRFFLSTERGREAFNTVKELGAESEWSFGFPRNVKTTELTDEWRGKGARRIISSITPIEASPVFVGAGIGTQTVAAKEAENAAAAVEAEAKAKAEQEAAARKAEADRLAAINADGARIFARGKRFTQP